MSEAPTGPIAGGPPVVVEKTEVIEERTTWFRFLLQQAPYVALIVLAFVGIAYTGLNPSSSLVYWQLMPVLMGAIAIGAGLRHRRHIRHSRFRLVLKQAAHWLAFLVCIELFKISSLASQIPPVITGLFTLNLLAVATFVDGLYNDYRLCIVGVGMWVALVCVAVVRDAALVILVVGVATLAAVFLAHRLFRRFRRVREDDYETVPAAATPHGP